MEEHQLSLTRIVNYDSSDESMQWRCHMHAARAAHGLMSVALTIFVFSVLLAHLAPIFIVGAAFSIVAGYLIQTSIMVAKRTSGPRMCTTTINEDCVHDLTPDSNKTYAWHRIKKVEISRGDIYFITMTGAVFVPRSAFKDEASVIDFYTQAIKLWHRGSAKKGRNQKHLPSSSSRGIAGDMTPPGIEEDLLAEDESVWLALEAEHKKQKQQSEGPGSGN
jgi:hypothetical protein